LVFFYIWPTATFHAAFMYSGMYLIHDVPIAASGGSYWSGEF
jgi:hypothetical protein